MQTKLISYVLAIVVFCALVVAAYTYGYNQAQKDAKMVELQELQEAKTQYEKVAKELTEANKKLAEKKVEYVQVTKEVIRDVVKYKDNPNAKCSPDDEWLRIRKNQLDAANTRVSIDD